MVIEDKRRRKFNNYIRTCKRCGAIFKSKCRNGNVCMDCQLKKRLKRSMELISL